MATLVLASLTALYVNQRIRREGLVLDAIHVTPVFTPDGDGRSDRATIGFRIKGPDEIDLELLDEQGEAVRRLARAELLANREVTYFRWNGRTDDGSPAPPGPYTLRIHQRDRDRTITPSETILLLSTEEKSG